MISPRPLVVFGANSKPLWSYTLVGPGEVFLFRAREWFTSHDAAVNAGRARARYLFMRMLEEVYE